LHTSRNKFLGSEGILVCWCEEKTDTACFEKCSCSWLSFLRKEYLLRSHLL